MSGNFQNRRFLIRTLESISSLDGRYEKIRCVNCDIRTGIQNQGALSVVFKAYDSLLDKYVALKFFDPDHLAFDNYRVKAFQREPEILKKIINRSRCLQLSEDLKIYRLEVEIDSTKEKISIDCQYFVVDWIENEIDGLFEKQQDISTKDKLILFDNIVLALAALHKHEIAHRDVKPDNFREYQRKTKDLIKKTVVAIDLGCAAKTDMGHLVEDYVSNVGAPAYSAPEARAGLAGDRKLAFKTDAYAIGCLLFELFNVSYYFDSILKDPEYAPALGSIVIHCTNMGSDKREDEFYSFIDRLILSMTPPSIHQSGNSIPKSISYELDQLIYKLTYPDPRKRLIDFEWLSKRIKSLIRVLDNQKYEKYKAFKREQRKRMSLIKAQKKQEKLLSRKKNSEMIVRT